MAERGEGGRKTTLDPNQILAMGPQSTQSPGIQQGNGSDWFGPLNPPAPTAPADVTGRQFDYPSGYNLNIGPRAYETISFAQLRAVADGYDLLRLIIETRKDQMSRLRWTVRPKADDTGKANTDKAAIKRSKELTEFFTRPDRRNTWDDWLRALLEDLLVIDAATLYPRRTYGGALYSLELIDGATIKRVIDNSGRTAPPPAPAYQQVLHGLPATNYTADQLIYAPRNVRTNRVYGYSPVEQVVMTVNIALRRQLFQLQFFTEGNVPEALIGVPDTWTPEQIKMFQEWWDSLLAGDSAARRHARFVPGGIGKTFIQTKDTEIFGKAEEWMARVICFAFSVSPQPFIQQMNRATADTDKERSEEEGLNPTKDWVKNLIDDILFFHLDAADFEFAWLEDEEIDQAAQAEILGTYTAKGIMTIDEAREKLGLSPFGGVAGEPMVLVATGYVPLDAYELDAAAAEEMAADGSQPDANGETPKDTGGDKASDDTGDDEGVGKFAAGPFAKAARFKPISTQRRAVRQGIARVRGRLRSFLRKQAPKIAAEVIGLAKDHLAEKMSPPDASGHDAFAQQVVDQIDMTGWAVLIDPTAKDLKRIMRDSGAKALQQIKVSEEGITELVFDEAADWAQKRAAELVGMRKTKDGYEPNPNADWAITDSTREMLRGTVATAVEEGWSTDRLADAIEESVAFSPERAERIARTEILKANNEGQLISYRQAASIGVKLKKAWLTAQDDLVSEECAANGDAGAIDLDDEFPSGDSAPPAHPNCRCALVPVTLDENEE